ncbi:MAG: hypothetical protein R3A52_03335 [Polyangiales bacterium]
MTAPLSRAEAVRAACDEGAVRVAKVNPGSGEALLRAALGRAEVHEAALAPLRIKGRAALVLWADLGEKSPPPTTVRALGEFVEECSAAFARIILEKKRASSAPPPASSSVPSPIPSMAPRESRSNRLARNFASRLCRA